MISHDSLLELVQNTRSIRRFKPDPVPDEYIDKIIEVARWAPSGFNSQPWEFIIVKKKEFRDKIAGFIKEYLAPNARLEATRESWQKTIARRYVGLPNDFSTAPVYVILFGDTRTQVGLPMSIRFDACRRQTVYISSLANAFLYMHLAASALGLASQWVSGIQTPLVHCLTKDLLGIPRELEVYDMLAVGYPAAKSRPKLLRDRAKMVHHDYCGAEDFRTDEEVREFVKKTRNWVIATQARRADK